MENINLKIDHTLLRPDATQDDIDKLCQEAIDNDFRSVCVASSWVSHIAETTKDKNLKICTVIGFPHGNNNLVSKVIEVEDAIGDATEFDAVVNIGAIKSQKWDYVESEISELRKYTYPYKLKYIIEIAYLNDFEIKKMCDLLIKHEVDYVKTSTGYGPRGATVDDIKKLKDFTQNSILIKASGGISDLKKAEAMLEAGADIIGTSKSLEIMRATRNGKDTHLERH